METATHLIPYDGQIASSTSAGNTTLYCQAGSDAADVNGHDVYLGTSEIAVSTAITISDEYQGRQTAESFDATGLSNSNAYYWHIDEVNDLDPNLDHESHLTQRAIGSNGCIRKSLFNRLKFNFNFWT